MGKIFGKSPNEGRAEHDFYATDPIAAKMLLSVEKFDKNKKLSEYADDEFLWARPALDERYFDEIMTIFGHTPTVAYGEEYDGRIIKTDTWIDIDMGAGFGRKPVLLRLDDMKEFRLK